MRLRLVLLAFGAACTVALPAVCQNPLAALDNASGAIGALNRGSSGTTLRPDIRVNSTLVLIPVVVTDRLNRLVLGLAKENFRLFEEDREQQIFSLSSGDVPVSIGLVFDCSGSMENKLWKSQAAVAEFLRAANREDEFFLVEFNNRARLEQPFTTNPREIQNHLAGAVAQGATALLDAVHLAMLEMRAARNSRKALLIVSDGGDNRSRHTEYEIRSLVKEADVQIYAIGIYGARDPHWPTPEELAGPGLLAGVAEQTGGRQYPIRKLEDLPRIAAEIGETIRNQYVLSYKPQTLPPSGKYRRVQVRLHWPDGTERPRVFWKHGYFAPAN
jgi:Ca-activated chloride channel family protein